MPQDLGAETKSHGSQEKKISHREHTRRINNEHVRAEALVNSVGKLGSCVREAAAATHSLTCGVPDRESNKIKYLREAFDLIDAWQQQLQGGTPVSLPSCDQGDGV